MESGTYHIAAIVKQNGNDVVDWSRALSPPDSIVRGGSKRNELTNQSLLFPCQRKRIRSSYSHSRPRCLEVLTTPLYPSFRRFNTLLRWHIYPPVDTLPSLSLASTILIPPKDAVRQTRYAWTHKSLKISIKMVGTLTQYLHPFAILPLSNSFPLAA